MPQTRPSQTGKLHEQCHGANVAGRARIDAKTRANVCLPVKRPQAVLLPMFCVLSQVPGMHGFLRISIPTKVLPLLGLTWLLALSAAPARAQLGAPAGPVPRALLSARRNVFGQRHENAGAVV